jgi:hypothetical protein
MTLTRSWHYSAQRMPDRVSQDVRERMNRYLDRLFGRLEERVENRVVERVEATLDVLGAPELMEDLRQADAQPDEEARSFEEIRRELDRAKTQA